MPVPKDRYLTGLQAALQPVLSPVLPQLGAILDLRQLVYVCVSCSCLLALQGRHLNCREFCCSTLKRLLAASAWCIYRRLLTAQQKWHNGPDTSCTLDYKVWCLSLRLLSSPFWGKVWAVPAFFPTLFTEPWELFVNTCLRPLVHNLVPLKDHAVNHDCSGVVQWVRAPSIWSKQVICSSVASSVRKGTSGSSVLYCFKQIW